MFWTDKRTESGINQVNVPLEGPWNQIYCISPLILILSQHYSEFPPNVITGRWEHNWFNPTVYIIHNHPFVWTSHTLKCICWTFAPLSQKNLSDYLSVSWWKNSITVIKRKSLSAFNTQSIDFSFIKVTPNSGKFFHLKWPFLYLQFNNKNNETLYAEVHWGPYLITYGGESEDWGLNTGSDHLP